MSTYYEYQDVKLMIAHKLMNMDGWKVYGYSADQSDSMTDYYCPAHWGGIAEKNGYILCVDVYGAAEAAEIREYNYRGFSYDAGIFEKIAKLQQMTTDRGATEAEANSAKMAIERLQKTAEENTENRNKYTVTGMIPAHMAHPSRCNWHIEKDGTIIAKGNGILKYAAIDSYYRYENTMKTYQEFKRLGAEAWEKENAKYLLNHSHYHSTPEEAAQGAKYNREKLEKESKQIEAFEKFINKLDTTCGGLIGEGDGTVYEKVTVTDYKTEIKPIETTTGSIKEGQLFKLKINFNYGHNKGQVFRIHETEYNGKKLYHAYKLNGKNTKECTGKADSSNRWGCFNEKFLAWIESGAIAWCELQEVRTPYEVEKVVKKTVKASKTPNTEASYTGSETDTEDKAFDVSNLTYIISEDTDTRTDEKIYLVKVDEKLSRDDYIKLSKYIKSIGGYYSKFKHAFLFREDPTSLLNIDKKESDNVKREFTIKQIAPKRWFYTYIEPNSIGEQLVIELYIYESDPLDKNSMPYLWSKYGRIDRLLSSCWYITTYVTDTEGNCYGVYNPQLKAGTSIDFNWMLEATEENKQKLLDEVLRLFITANGETETATERKRKTIEEFAENESVELYTELPEGWKIINGTTAPKGSAWISNIKPFGSGLRKKGLMFL